MPTGSVPHARTLAVTPATRASAETRASRIWPINYGPHEPPKQPAASAPLAPPPDKLRFRGWHCVELAPGIELSVADDAPVHSRDLFARVVEILEAVPKGREPEVRAAGAADSPKGRKGE